MQTTAGNRSCVTETEYKDQRLEITDLKTESNNLKNEVNFLKELILKLVGHLYQVLSVLDRSIYLFILIYVYFIYCCNQYRQQQAKGALWKRMNTKIKHQRLLLLRQR